MSALRAGYILGNTPYYIQVHILSVASVIDLKFLKLLYLLGGPDGKCFARERRIQKQFSFAIHTYMYIYIYILIFLFGS